MITMSGVDGKSRYWIQPPPFARQQRPPRCPGRCALDGDGDRAELVTACSVDAIDAYPQKIKRLSDILRATCPSAHWHQQERKAMRALCLVLILLGSAAAAKAECLQEIGQLREQVASLNQTRPTAQSEAAARELQTLERSEAADEIECVNTLVKARQMLASPVVPTGNDRYANDRAKQP